MPTLVNQSNHKSSIITLITKYDSKDLAPEYKLVSTEIDEN